MLRFITAVVALSFGSGADAQSAKPESVLNTMIQQGECTKKDDWCLLSAEKSQTGFVLRAHANRQVSDVTPTKTLRCLATSGKTLVARRVSGHRFI